MSIITIQIKAGLTAGYKDRSKVVNVLKLGFYRELRTLPVHISRQLKNTEETSHMFMTQVPTNSPIK